MPVAVGSPAGRNANSNMFMLPARLSVKPSGMVHGLPSASLCIAFPFAQVAMPFIVPSKPWPERSFQTAADGSWTPVPVLSSASQKPASPPGTYERERLGYGVAGPPS